MTPQSAVRLEITGRVQGVGFRAWTSREARRLGLSGWVRNRGDGSVEVLACGPSEALQGLERLCWQGPSAARVTAVRRSPAEAGAEFGPGAGFEERASI